MKMNTDDMEFEDEVKEPSQELNAITYAIIGAAIEVHRELGPGFGEEIYQRAMEVELGMRSIPFQRQAAFIVMYKGTKVGSGRIDLVVVDQVVVELKAVDAFAPIHRLQVISYLKAIGLKVGLLINFNVLKLIEGVRRVAN
jgi:GxxExxY protein